MLYYPHLLDCHVMGENWQAASVNSEKSRVVIKSDLPGHFGVF